MNVSNYQVTENYKKYEFVVLACLPEKDKNVFLSQSTAFQVFIKNLKANGSYLGEVEVKKKAQLYDCIIGKELIVSNLVADCCNLKKVQVKKKAELNRCILENDLVVEGNLDAKYCELKTAQVKGKVDLYNCYQMDSIMAGDDAKLINDNIEKTFIRSVDTQKNAFIRNMHIGELTCRPSHIIVVDCDISTIRIKKTKNKQTECILEFKGISTVEKIISEGVDIDIRGRELFAR